MLISKVLNDKGETITWRKGIASVFGEFFSKLDDSHETEEKLQNTLSHDTRAVDEAKSNGEENNEKMPLVTDEEIQAAINKLKKG